MAKHSTLTNPDDLHYAKVRVFSGAPSAITPDFVGELLCDDQQKIYRANGTGQGDLIELAPQGTGSGTGGNSTALATVVEGYPQDFPVGIGQIYFDLNSMRMFVASELSALSWLPVDRKPSLNLAFSNNSIDSSGSNLSVTYAQSTIPSSNPTFDYYFFGGEFSDLVNSGIETIIRRKGCGIYKFEFDIEANPNLYLDFSGSAIDCNFYTYNQDGKAFLVIPDFAITSSDATANFTLNLLSN